MFQDMRRLDAMQDEVLECLELAEECGLGAAEGQAAYKMGMERFDRFCELKADQIYSPLCADLLTRDYVSRLDSQLLGLSGRIDILRTHIEIALASDTMTNNALAGSLRRLKQQLRIRFRREAALTPVYETWKQRQCADWSTSIPAPSEHIFQA